MNDELPTTNCAPSDGCESLDNKRGNLPTTPNKRVQAEQPTTPQPPCRINRFLAAAGLGSRRFCEDHILQGRVSINGSVCRDFATKVTDQDDVRFNGRQIRPASLRYILLHKPPGYVSTRSDRHAERTIFDLLPLEAATLFHVGRLDKESEGLLLLTNDGNLSQQLLHPSRGIDKEYEVTIDQAFTPKAAAALKKGTWIEGSVARVESVVQLSPYKIKLVLHQGIKRQIRVMLGQLGFKVKRLVRTRLGPLKLLSLSSGQYRTLRPQEVKALQVASKEAKKTDPAKAKRLLISHSPQRSTYRGQTSRTTLTEPFTRNRRVSSKTQASRRGNTLSGSRRTKA